MSAPDASPERSHVRYVLAVIGLVFVVLWLRPLTSSFWLDELGNWWTVKDSLGDAVSRALEFQGQSPAYNVLAWVTGRIVGPNELLLRLPSLAASIGSILILHRLVRRLIDGEAALFAALGFVGLDGVAFAASEFRPYAIALLFVLASMLLFVRWLDEGRTIDAVSYALVTAAVVWGHYLFALALLAQVSYAAVRIRAGSTSVRPRSLVLAWGAALVLVLPLVGQLASLWGRRFSLTIPFDGTVENLLSSSLPLTFVGGLIFGGLFAWVVTRFTISMVPGSSGAAVLLWGWFLIPIGVLYAVSLSTPFDFYSPRYYLSAAPAGAALFGWAVRCVDSAPARRVIAVVYAILAVLVAASPNKAGEDWRQLAVAERSLAQPTTPVLMHPSFVEAGQLDWLADPERRSYLLAPTSFYPMNGMIEPLPYLTNDDGLEYVDGRLAAITSTHDRFLVVLSRYQSLAYQRWLEGRLGDQGWTSTVVDRFGTIDVVEFTRGAAEPT